MLKALLICAAVSALIIGCSTAQPRPDAKTGAAATTRPCSLDSASRIPARAPGCSATPGRTYSNEDVERTGQTNVGDALQMLDPSIAVHH